MRPLEAMLVLGLCALLLWGIWALFARLGRLIFGARKPLQLAPEEEDRRAMEIVSRPVPMPGGQWMHRTFRWEPCDPPRDASAPIVVGVDEPATQNKPRFSGANMTRSN